VKLLLPHGLSGDYDFATSPPPSITDVYSHYQHSLNSLHEIIDRVSLRYTRYLSEIHLSHVVCH